MLLGLLALLLEAGAARAVDIKDIDRELKVQEYRQQVAQAEASFMPAGLLEGQQDRERELVMGQLEVVTGDEETRYILERGDVVRISFNDRALVNSAAYQISGEGDVFLPLAGKTRVAGLNQKEARARVNEVLGAYIRNPQVRLRINMDGQVMVLGAVRRPGIVRLSSQLTVMEALMRAGGYNTGTAKMKGVLVMRGPAQKPAVTRVDLQKMISRGDRADNISLKPGDLVYVPTTLMSNVDSFVHTVYQRFLIWSGFGGQDLIEPGKPPLGPF
jgi:protein involved in polysaccharide export with SLBB domain